MKLAGEGITCGDPKRGICHSKCAALQAAFIFCFPNLRKDGKPFHAWIKQKMRFKEKRILNAERKGFDHPIKNLDVQGTLDRPKISGLDLAPQNARAD